MSSISDNARNALASFIETIPGEKNDASILLLNKSDNLEGFSAKAGKATLKKFNDSPVTNSRGEKLASDRAGRVLGTIWNVKQGAKYAVGHIAQDAMNSLPEGWDKKNWPKDSYNEFVQEFVNEVQGRFGYFLGAKAANGDDTLAAKFSNYKALTVADLKEALEETGEFANNKALEMFGVLHEKQQRKANALLQAGAKHDPSSNVTPSPSPSPSPSPLPSKATWNSKLIKDAGSRRKSVNSPGNHFIGKQGHSTGSPSPSPQVLVRANNLGDEKYASPPAENNASHGAGLNGSSENIYSEFSDNGDLRRFESNNGDGGYIFPDGTKVSNPEEDLESVLREISDSNSGKIESNNNGGPQKLRSVPEEPESPLQVRENDKKNVALNDGGRRTGIKRSTTGGNRPTLTKSTRGGGHHQAHHSQRDGRAVSKGRRGEGEEGAQ
ncbi:MAG: hypothetical protein ACR652_20310 [Methylocystis sp.]|uniref:hypothetical protein n=1 Tax=Methylocystis sp. TaxID=1911079 RepID=UPI003DA69B1F